MKKLLTFKHTKFILAFLSLIILMSSLMIRPMITNTMGTDIQLHATVYNPHNVFLGSSLRLDYDLTKVTFDHVDDDIVDIAMSEDWNLIDDELDNKDLYMTFSVDETGLYAIDRVSFTKPDTSLYLIAHFDYVWYDYEERQLAYDETGEWIDPEPIGIEFSIPMDDYYMSEAKAEEMIGTDYNASVAVTLRIYNGHSVLKGLTVLKDLNWGLFFAYKSQ